MQGQGAPGPGGAHTSQFVSAAARDARWFPADLHAGALALALVRTERETLSSLGCIADARWDTRDLPKIDASLSLLADVCTGPRPRLNFIWHTAYCCSTALSETIDVPGQALSLREPKILVALANAKRMGQLARHDTKHATEIVFRLLARPFVDGETITLKPAPAANCLAREAAALTDGRSLFLYSDLASFLISIALDGEVRRGFQRRTFYLILNDGNEQQRWNAQLLAEMSDLQIAALVWHMEIAEFHRALPALKDRAASLDCDAFLADPASTIAKIDDFFGLGLGAAHAGAVAKGPLLRRHAKQPDMPFAITDRARLHREIPQRLSEDVAAIVAWSYEVCRTTPRGAPLPNPLVPLAKSYS